MKAPGWDEKPGRAWLHCWESGSRLARSRDKHGWNAPNLGAVGAGHVETRGRCPGLGDMQEKMGISRRRSGFPGTFAPQGGHFCHG